MLCALGAGGYPTRSELLFGFLTKAIRAKVADDVIVNACLDDKYSGNGIFAHCQENKGRR